MTIIINVIGQQMAVKGHKVPLAPHTDTLDNTSCNIKSILI